MRKISKKLALPVIAAAGAVMGGWSTAHAGFTNVLSAPTVSGGFQIYTVSTQNTGGGTGTKLAGFDVTVTTSGGAFLKMDNSQDLGDGLGAFDGILDVNITGNTGSAYGPAVRAFGSNFGTFARMGGGALAGDAENGVNDSLSSPTWSSDLHAGGPTAVYSSLTKLEIAQASISGGAAATVAVKFINIVVPTGTTFTVNGQVGGDQGSAQTFSLSSPSAGPTGPIVLLQAATPTNTGGKITNGAAGTPAAPQGNYTPLGAATSTLTVTGAANVYSAGFIKTLTAGTNAGYTATGGFSGGNLEIYLLHLSSSAADAQLVADINGNNTGVVASLAANDPTVANLGGIAWDIELKFAAPGAGENGNFGFNFAGDSNATGITVTDIAAVPEPATAGLLLVGGLGLLARRRRTAK